MGEHPDLLRGTGDRVHAVGANRREQGIERGSSGKSRERSRRERNSTRVGVATASVTCNAANPGDLVACARGGKYGGCEGELERGRIEGN